MASLATDPDVTEDMIEIATAAYRLTSDGALTRARPWQAALYARLSDPVGDIGGLLTAPTHAGKFEAVLIPALGLHRGGAPRRLFVIGPDGSPLDDYLYRAVPYLRAWVQADGTARTLCLDVADEDSLGNVCRRFYPDGSEDPQIVTNPLEADVDLILTTFSRFRELFFGSGGVHALPTALMGPSAEAPRRDLFFFDEAHSYTDDAFSRFHRLVEFLFAEDLDVITATSTMPAAFREELSFLEPLSGPGSLEPPSLKQPPRTLAYKSSADPLTAIESEIRRAYFQNSRVFGVAETEAEAEALYARLIGAYPSGVYLYHSGQAAPGRRRTYAQLRELEKEGEGYLLLTTGEALEASDLDATVLLTTLCPPENLIRRAGRCNRRGDLPAAQVVVFGDTLSPHARPLNEAQAAEYRAALHAQTDLPFDPEFWKAFI